MVPNSRFDGFGLGLEQCKDADAAVLAMAGHTCAHVQAAGYCSFKLFSQMCGCACASTTHARLRRAQGTEIGFADTDKCMLQEFHTEIAKLNTACCSAADADDSCVNMGWNFTRKIFSTYRKSSDLEYARNHRYSPCLCFKTITISTIFCT